VRPFSGKHGSTAEFLALMQLVVRMLELIASVAPIKVVQSLDLGLATPSDTGSSLARIRRQRTVAQPRLHRCGWK
jgi:hypothetical protein